MATEPTTMESLAAMIKELKDGARRRPRRDPDEDEPVTRRDANERFARMTKQRDAEAERAEKALKALEDLAALHKSEIAKLQEQAGKDVSAGVKRVEETYALRDAMHEADDDGVAAVRRAYEAIPEAKRPASILDFWKGLEPEKAPKALRPYLKPAEDVEDPPASGAGKGPGRPEQEPAPRQQKKAPAVDEARGKGKVKSWADYTDEEYDAAMRKSQMERLTAPPER